MKMPPTVFYMHEVLNTCSFLFLSISKCIFSHFVMNSHFFLALLKICLMFFHKIYMIISFHLHMCTFEMNRINKPAASTPLMIYSVIQEIEAKPATVGLQAIRVQHHSDQNCPLNRMHQFSFFVFAEGLWNNVPLAFSPSLSSEIVHQVPRPGSSRQLRPWTLTSSSKTSVLGVLISSESVPVTPGGSVFPASHRSLCDFQNTVSPSHARDPRG